MKALVIGYGNTLRGDDGFGPVAAARLAEALEGTAREAESEVVICHQLTVELCEAVAGAARVLFVDVALGESPGRIGWRRLAPAEEAPGSFSHHVHPALLLTLARELYGRAPEAVLLTVTGTDFEGGEVLSPAVAAAVEPVLARILAWLWPSPGFDPFR